MRERRYYAFARHGLVSAMQLAKVAPGSTVALPEFICREVLASLEHMQAVPYFYEIADDLSIYKPHLLAEIPTILVVNFFGFAANLKPLLDYSAGSGQVIIEDNAHGWLSKDEPGVPLGSRTDIGVTSFRKTIRSLDGAYVEWNGSKFETLVPELGPRQGGAPLSYRVRRAASRLERITGLRVMSSSRLIVRSLRQLQTGQKITTSPESERILPRECAIHESSLQAFKSLSLVDEVQRRRKAYDACLHIANEAKVPSLFDCLPANTCPMGFPYFGGFGNQREFERLVSKQRLGEVIHWPDLPTQSKIDKASKLRRVKLVNFLQ